MKHTRLLEIIREEIAGALNESGLYTLKNQADAKKGLAGTIDPDEATEKSSDFLRRYKKVAESEELEEDTLNEEPFIDSALDITGTTPENFNQDALQNAIDDAVKVLQQENPDADVQALAGKLQKANNPVNLGPKSKLSSELKNALQKVYDVIQEQGQIFNNVGDINDLIKLAKEPSQIDRLEKLKEKGYTFILGNPQAITAIEKSLGLKPKNNDSLGAVKDKPKTEPKAKAEKSPKAEKLPKTEKTATLTKGDDGFDTVESSDADNDKEATQNIGSDPTAKKLGKIATGKEETFNRILGLIEKYKDDKDKVDAFINKAENEYKLSKTLLDQLKRVAGRDVKI